MARINIEDSLFRDNRFFNLSLKLGSKTMALGAVVELYIVAQEYWKKDRSLIPKKVWVEQGLNDALINVGLVEEKEHGFYAKGSESCFAWILSRAQNGQKGGSAIKKGSSNDFNSLDASTAKHSEAQGSTAKPLTLTPSLTHNNNNKINILTNIYSSELKNSAPSSKQTFQISSFQDFEKILSPNLKNNLSALYPDYEFLRREFIKMHSWLIANPKKNLKTSRGWSQFISGWLDRAWPKHQASLASTPESRNTVASAELDDRIANLFGGA